MEYVHPQVQRSRDALTAAIIDLVAEHGYGKLTVSEITDYAQVGAATLYRHYHNVDNLIDAAIGQAVKDLCRHLAEQDTLRAEALALYTYCRDHDKFLRAYIALPAAHPARASAKDILAEYVQRRYKHPDADVVPLDVWTTHIVEAICLLLAWYETRLDTHTPQQMADIHVDLIARATKFGVLVMRDNWIPADDQLLSD